MHYFSISKALYHEYEMSITLQHEEILPQFDAFNLLQHRKYSYLEIQTLKDIKTYCNMAFCLKVLTY